MNFRDYIKKLQNLSEMKKKIVLWTIVVILAVVMGFFWIKGTINNFSKLNFGTIKNELPSVDIKNIGGSSDITK